MIHDVVNIFKSKIGGPCRFISELDRGRYLVVSGPFGSKGGKILSEGSIRYYVAEGDAIDEAKPGDIEMGRHRTVLKRIREIEDLDLNAGRSIYNILEKYSFQKAGVTMNYHDSYAEDEDQRLRMREYVDWVNDGLQTGIRDNREFYRIQKVLFGKTVYVFE